MKNKIIKLLKFIGLYKIYKIPIIVIKKYTVLNESDIINITNIASAYCNRENYASDENRQTDINALSFGRLNKFRKTHIPFLFETIGLEGKKILEIGCGSGASSVCLAEQGAIVTGVDIDTKAIEFAQKRAQIYNQKIEFINLNAIEIEKLNEFEWDVIIYFASLEHMTPQERKVSLTKAIKLIKNGGHICVFGTPNRLWPDDIHTSNIPFFMWLQDDIALDYSKFSKRKEYSEISNIKNKESFVNFYRWGRGCSFHEFHVASGNADSLKVIGALPIFLRRYSLIQKISYKLSIEYKYKKILRKFGPDGIHPGFYESYLDIIMEK